jgi:hypothetical protein
MIMTPLTRLLDIQVIRRLVRQTMAGVLVAFFLAGTVLLIQRASDLFLLDEAGYPDTYVLYDVLRYQNDGVIYRDLSQPPYLPSLYSPLMYILYSLPVRIAENPFVGPRLVVLAAFLSCLGAVVSIVRELIPVRFAWVWAVLLVGSTRSLWDWILRLRGDFIGIAFSLLAIRLLMSRSSGAAVLAGLCAGLATQFKITFVAALAAGASWLLLRRQWKDLAGFVVAGVITSAGVYLVFAIREPRMLSQITTLGTIVDLRGWVKFVYQAATEPVVLFALMALPPIAWRSWSRWSLLFFFFAVSFAIGVLTDLQVGGGENYFFEALFAAIPMAVLGILRLMVVAARHIQLGVFLTALFGAYLLAPRAQEIRLQVEQPPPSVAVRNEAFRKLEHALHGRRIFSTVPRLAFVDPAPPLMEPFLLNYMLLNGTFDPQPLLAAIRRSEFDVVITFTNRIIWRSLPQIGPDLREAVTSAYQPQCQLDRWLMHLPRQPRPTSAALARELADAGCVPIPPEQQSRPSW